MLRWRTLAPPPQQNARRSLPRLRAGSPAVPERGLAATCGSPRWCAADGHAGSGESAGVCACGGGSARALAPRGHRTTHLQLDVDSQASDGRGDFAAAHGALGYPPSRPLRRDPLRQARAAVRVPAGHRHGRPALAQAERALRSKVLGKQAVGTVPRRRQRRRRALDAVAYGPRRRRCGPLAQPRLCSDRPLSQTRGISRAAAVPQAHRRHRGGGTPTAVGGVRKVGGRLPVRGHSPWAAPSAKATPIVGTSCRRG